MGRRGTDPESGACPTKRDGGPSECSIRPLGTAVALSWFAYETRTSAAIRGRYFAGECWGRWPVPEKLTPVAPRTEYASGKTVTQFTVADCPKA
jgi:hypothetical protein